ncbi:MAG: suppressor of fused domain protein [Defluviitaleaceae bacterium]|nr:suppressor of fused domain protein [Defluviitaleaceae bacterium]
MNERPDDYLTNELSESPGGSRIFRHEDSDRDGLIAPADSCKYMDEVCAHFDSLFPQRETRVLHEIVSDIVHIDVHVMFPLSDDDFFVIYTTGMSDLPMVVPKELDNPDDWKHSELFMYLPASWNPEGEFTRENFWHVELVKFLARMPHMYNTWLADGHTIPNGPNYEPFLGGSQLSSAIILGLLEPLFAADGTRISMNMVVPLTRAETEHKLEYGTDALLKLFDEHDVPLVVDENRRSVV